MPDPSTFNVLCVDDDADNLLSLAWLLKQEGYGVLEARTGAEALARAGGADLVLLDVHLPDLSGFEVCRRIKAGPGTALVPVVLLSGHFVRTEHKVEGLEDGGDVYLTKPYEPRELLGQVKALLRIRQAELSLRRQATILDQIHDAVISTDLDGRVTQWNKGAERLFGYSAEEMLGRPVAVLYPPGDGEAAVREVLAAVRAEGRAEREKRARGKSGEEFYVRSSFSPLLDPRGEVTGVVGYSLDVTQKRVLEAQVWQAQKMEAVGQLAGGLAHDFNNLMTVVTGFADVILADLPPDDPKRPAVAEIKRAGERAAALTQQLLAFSSRQLLRPEVLDVNALVSDMEAELRGGAGRGVVVVVSTEPRPGLVRADPGQVRQILRNLATNAVEAMPDGGTLGIVSRNVELGDGDAVACAEVRPGPYVLLTVTDTGSGMTAEVMECVFEPFFTTKRDGEGSAGLGLAAVYGIVKQSGGHIRVVSTVGAGTTFNVYLPRLPG